VSAKNGARAAPAKTVLRDRSISSFAQFRTEIATNFF
jgi:hypothetical protein